MYTINPLYPKPINSLLLLIGLVIVGSILGSIIGFVLAIVVTGETDVGELLSLAEGGGQNLTFLRTLQGGSSIGMFVLPPLVLGMIERNRGAYIPGGITKMRLLTVVFLISICSSPIIEFSGKLNALMEFPDQLAGLEQWMRQQEANAEAVTMLLLKDVSYLGLAGNLIVIAVIAAIGEEFLFRGALQTILIRWLRNPHVAIWVAAIVFSAIHLQFYGFLPRMLLGALFGYLFYWSNNIWLPIFGHFVNNAGVILMTYSYQKQGNSLDTMDYMPDSAIYTLFIGLILTGILMYIFWKWTKAKE